MTIYVRDVAYVRFTAPDLDVMETFATASARAVTTEIPCIAWRARRDSNPQPSDPKTMAGRIT